jgi:hypothetical protein
VSESRVGGGRFFKGQIQDFLYTEGTEIFSQFTEAAVLSVFFVYKTSLLRNVEKPEEGKGMK